MKVRLILCAALGALVGACGTKAVDPATPPPSARQETPAEAPSEKAPYSRETPAASPVGAEAVVPADGGAPSVAAAALPVPKAQDPSGQDPSGQGSGRQDPTPKGPNPQNPGPSAEDARAAIAAAMKLFEDEGIHVDLAKGTVAVDCVMNDPVDPIEFALVHRRGKTHEGLLYTEAQPSIINGALMTLGYTPGVNVAHREMDPLPTGEEVRMGAQYVEVFPPRGMLLHMTVRWQEDGEVREITLEDMMFDLATGREVQDATFVYLGGRMDSLNRGDEPVFFADLEGNLISTVYRAPANHLGTIVHPHATDQETWWLTNRCPDAGTQVELVFYKEETDLHRARRARLEAEGAEAARAMRDPSAGPTEQGSAGHAPVDPGGAKGK